MKKVLRWIINLLPLFLSILGCVAFLKDGKSWFELSMDKSFHFNLITVNALFGGFLYTNYSLLIGLLDNSLVEKIKNTDIVQKRNRHILKGILYATVSVVAGLYLVLIVPAESGIKHTAYVFMQNAEIFFMAFLIFYFLLSLYEMSVLIKNAHNSRGSKTDKELKELKTEIKNNSTKQKE